MRKDTEGDFTTETQRTRRKNKNSEYRGQVLGLSAEASRWEIAAVSRGGHGIGALAGLESTTIHGDLEGCSPLQPSLEWLRSPPKPMSFN
jgi:hypothetical protein